MKVNVFENVVTTRSCDFNGERTSYFCYGGEIKPYRALYRKRIYEVELLNDAFKLKWVNFVTHKNRLTCVHVEGSHPNINPETNVYCLPSDKKGAIFTEKLANQIIDNLHTYYADSCYWNPFADAGKVYFIMTEQGALHFNSKGEVM